MPNDPEIPYFEVVFDAFTVAWCAVDRQGSRLACVHRHEVMAVGLNMEAEIWQALVMKICAAQTRRERAAREAELLERDDTLLYSWI